MGRIPAVYRETVLGKKPAKAPPSVQGDPHCLAALKHYRSLMPLAQEARKPMFSLTAADGALGGHAAAVQDCYGHFRTLARRVAERCGVRIP
jgi:hypothetical protein